MPPAHERLELALARGIMGALGGIAAGRFELETRRPAATQRRTLLRILRQNRETEIGRKYEFSTIRDEAEYARRVPVVTAEELAPSIARMARGEPRVLTAEAPRYFCQTGGTTGTPKLSPVTPAYTREYQTTIHTFLHGVRRDHPDIFHGRSLYFVGTAEAGRTEAGIPFGTMTGYNFRALPAFMRRLYALPYETSLIDDYEAKYYTILRLAVPQDVRLLVSVTPSTLLLIGQKLAEHEELLVEEISAGTLSSKLRLRPELREALARRLAPDPACAARLRALRRASGGPLRPVDVWPNLRLLVCWKSGPSAPYIPELQRYYGRTPVRDAIYSATEGWMNVPLGDRGVGGALAVGTHFFEFFEEDDAARRGHPLLAEDLEVGRRYAILLTASSGMYRYDIKDIVTCVGRHHLTPIIAFSHKESGFSNLVGEKLSDAHVSAAAAAAGAETGLGLLYFTLAPSSAELPPRYVACVELAREAAESEARRFLEVLERVLGEQAWEYAAHRRAGDLGPPELVLLGRGTNDRLREAVMRRGGNEAQMKPRHLEREPPRLPGLEGARRVRLAAGPA
jgi:hypothetical protein